MPRKITATQTLDPLDIFAAWLKTLFRAPVGTRVSVFLVYHATPRVNGGPALYVGAVCWTGES